MNLLMNACCMMIWKRGQDIMKVWGIKIYTKIQHKKINKSYIPEMMGVIEAPITKMMKAYPDEFKFMRHQTKREKLEDRTIKKK